MKMSLLRSGGSSKAVLMVRLGLLALQGRNPWRTFNAAFLHFRIHARQSALANAGHRANSG